MVFTEPLEKDRRSVAIGQEGEESGTVEAAGVVFVEHLHEPRLALGANAEKQPPDHRLLFRRAVAAGGRYCEWQDSCEEEWFWL